MLQLQLIGNLGSDAVINQAAGKSVINFSVAVTEKYKDKNNVQQENTTWVSCAMWERDNLAPFLKRGTKVFVSGKPTTGAWIKDGDAVSELKITVYDLELLTPKKD